MAKGEVNMNTQYTYMKVIIMKSIILYNEHMLIKIHFAIK